MIAYANEMHDKNKDELTGLMKLRNALVAVDSILAEHLP